VTFPSTDRTTAGCANASDDLPCVGSIDPQPPVLELGQQIDSAVDREIATQPAAWLRRAVQGDHQHGATIDFPLVLQVELVLIELATGVAHRADEATPRGLHLDDDVDAGPAREKIDPDRVLLARGATGLERWR
jgi:hypothetical protein